MMLTTAQILLFAITVLAMIVVLLRYRQRRLGALSFLLWLLLWGAIGAVILFPNTTVVVARFVGIGRGADLVLYLSVMLNFYFIFRLVVRLDLIDREITQIVRNLALREEKPKI